MAGTGPKGTSFAREDISAMEVICDRNAAFHHKLNLGRIDVRWILTLQKPSNGKNSTNSSVQRGRSERSSTPQVSPVKADSDDGQELSHQREGNNDINPHSGYDDEPIPQIAGKPPNSARGSVASNSSKISVKQGGRRLLFVDPPESFSTVGTLDQTQVVDSKVKREPLINSPRSAFVLLKNGFAVADICAVPVQEYYNKALLDGVSLETVKMRVAAEEERRCTRFDNIQRTYETLCDSVTREEVVDAIRQHKFAEDITREEDEQRLKDIPHYAHPGRLDLTVLDSDCIDVLQRSRSRTLMEIRRSLDQKDRLMKQSIERETVVMERERESRSETIKVQLDAEGRRLEKADAAKEKRVEVERRVEQLIQAQEDMRELRRENLMQDQKHQQDRLKDKKQMAGVAAAAMIGERDRRRKQVREQQEQMLQDRREQLLDRYELASKLKGREVELKHEEAHRMAKNRRIISEKKRETIKQLTEIQANSRLQKHEEMEAEAQQRAREYNRMRELRQVTKKERARVRAERTSEIREQGELLKKHRTEELERDYQDKLHALDQAQRDKGDRATVAREMAAQVQLEKVGEKERLDNVSEFDKIAYISETFSKKRWMDKADEKRKVLATQVLQERQAMVRARQQVIDEMEAVELKRRKQAATEMLRAIEDFDITAHSPSRPQGHRPPSPRQDVSQRNSANSKRPASKSSRLSKAGSSANNRSSSRVGVSSGSKRSHTAPLR